MQDDDEIDGVYATGSLNQHTITYTDEDFLDPEEVEPGEDNPVSFRFFEILTFWAENIRERQDMGRAAFCSPYSYLFQVEGGPYQCGFCRFASTLDEVSAYPIPSNSSQNNDLPKFFEWNLHFPINSTLQYGYFYFFIFIIFQSCPSCHDASPQF